MNKSQRLKVGELYRRIEIAEMPGGNYQCALPHTNGEVTAGCYDPEMNPNAPSEILVGRGRDKEHYSQQLADEQTRIPIFLKRATREYEFVGYYRGVRYSVDRNEIREKNTSDRNDNDIAGVLYFEEAGAV